MSGDGQFKPRVLIAEDEVPIAIELAVNLKEAGFEPVGPALTSAEVEALAGLPDIHVAVVDHSLLNPQPVQIIGPLLERNVPVVVVTGYSEAVSVSLIPEAERVLKPAPIEEVVNKVRDLISRNSGRTGHAG